MEIKQTSIVVTTYLITFLNLGVRSSKWPNSILPNANIMLTMATSNHKDSVVHIFFCFCQLIRLCLTKNEVNQITGIAARYQLFQYPLLCNATVFFFPLFINRTQRHFARRRADNIKLPSLDDIDRDHRAAWLTYAPSCFTTSFRRPFALSKFETVFNK